MDWYQSYYSPLSVLFRVDSFEVTTSYSILTSMKEYLWYRNDQFLGVCFVSRRSCPPNKNENLLRRKSPDFSRLIPKHLLFSGLEVELRKTSRGIGNNITVDTTRDSLPRDSSPLSLSQTSEEKISLRTCSTSSSLELPFAPILFTPVVVCARCLRASFLLFAPLANFPLFLARARTSRHLAATHIKDRLAILYGKIRASAVREKSLWPLN